MSQEETNDRIKEYNKKWILDQQKCIFEDAPKDDIDWALVLYLFRHSKPEYGPIYKEKNVITIGKISTYFDLAYDDVEKRLRRMIWWVNVWCVHCYINSINTCNISEFGRLAIIKTLEIFEWEK